MKFTSELRDRPLFICGHPKAGTSLVRALLDSHPQLVVYPEETVFFRRFLPQAADLDLPGKIALAERGLIHIFTWNKQRPPQSQTGYPDRDYEEVSFESVRRAMLHYLDEDCRHNGDILAAAVMAFGSAAQLLSADTRRWVEKSPYNEFYADRIYSWWPQARCIHVLRDPRDNYVSYRRKHPDWAVEFFASNWKRSTMAGLNNRERYGDNRYLLLRYEDLAHNPTESIRQMLTFLEIEWAETLTAPTRAGEGWTGNSMFADRFEKISAAPVGRWMEQLATEDAAVIEAIAGKLLDKFDYLPDPNIPSLPLSTTWKAQWRAHTWPLRKRYYHRRKNTPS